MLDEYVLNDVHSGAPIVAGEQVVLVSNEIEEVTEANLRDAAMDLVEETMVTVNWVKGVMVVNMHDPLIPETLTELEGLATTLTAFEHVLNYMGYELPNVEDLEARQKARQKNIHENHGYGALNPNDVAIQYQNHSSVPDVGAV